MDGLLVGVSHRLAQDSRLSGSTLRLHTFVQMHKLCDYFRASRVGEGAGSEALKWADSRSTTDLRILDFQNACSWHFCTNINSMIE
jgi:hypothetical protein